MSTERIVSQFSSSPLLAGERPRLARPALRLVEETPAPGPRVVMRPAGNVCTQTRQRARRQLALIYGVVGLLLFAGWALRPGAAEAEPADVPAAVVVAEHVFALATPTATPEPVAQAAPASRLWQGFSPSVLYWEPLIVQWSDHYGLDPNKAATIMQIESCGDPQAISSAGARGLFQVMPFHFAAGEDALDPDTNAMRGLAYFAERLVQTGGDVGRAFAGYNGGQRAAASSWDQWAHETQRYYLWSTGIVTEIEAGKAESETLGKWLRAGGASLCAQAEGRLATAAH
jgi:hypothetical protein